MPNLNLDELERLAKAATPGPWDNVGAATIRRKKPDEFIAECAPIVIHSVKKLHKCMNNADYIVAACNAVPELIEENRALQKRVQELEKQRNWLAQKHAIAYIDAACDACTSHIGDCPICPLPQGTGLCIEVSEVTFVNAAEQAAKEAGE